MTDYVVRDTQLTSVADAIRAKGGTSDPLSFPDGFVSAVQAFPDAVTLDSLSVTENGIYTPSVGHAYSEVTVNVSGGGGDTDVEDGIITRTISGSYTNSTATNVGSYAFVYCTSLTAVNFPACSTIGNSVFRNCSVLYSAYFLGSSVPKINSSTFYGTPITRTTGTPGSVFVRASMLAAFQSASNWSTFSSRIVGLTDEQIAALDA